MPALVKTLRAESGDALLHSSSSCTGVRGVCDVWSFHGVVSTTWDGVLVFVGSSEKCRFVPDVRTTLRRNPGVGRSARHVRGLEGTKEEDQQESICECSDTLASDSVVIIEHRVGIYAA